MIYQNKKIGILGGSFDPIHNGHLSIAESAYRDFGLDEVWLVPAGHSPNKDENKMTSAAVRAEMAELAVWNMPYFKISNYEIEKDGTSYTYLTLSDFKEKYPETIFYFIMGADSLDYFECWRHPEIICQNAVILVAVRDDMDLNNIREKISHIQSLFHAEIYPLTCPKVDISSSGIRADLAKGILPQDKLPQAVLNYIQEKQLYQ